MIRYRGATTSDVDTVSQLMWEVSYIAQFLYSTSFSVDECLSYLAQSFVNESGRSSYKNFYLAESDEGRNQKIVGLVFYYDYSLHAIDTQMEDKLNPLSVDIVRPIYRSIIPHSLYISALIVEAGYRNLHIGERLINYVKEQARLQNYTSVSSHVWDDNQKGLSFYERNNFIRKEVVTFNSDTFLLPASKKIHLLEAALTPSN